MAELVRDVQVLYADREISVEPEPFVQVIVSGRPARLIDRAMKVAQAIYPPRFLVDDEGDIGTGQFYLSSMDWSPGTTDAVDGGWTLIVRFQPVGSVEDSIVWYKLDD